MTTCTLTARNDAGQPIHTAVIDMTQDIDAQIAAFLDYIKPLVLQVDQPISQPPTDDPADVEAFALRTAIVAYHLVTAAQKHRRRQLDQHTPLVPYVDPEEGWITIPRVADPQPPAPDPEQCPHCGSQMGIQKGDPDPTKYLCLYCGGVYQAQPPAATPQEEDPAAWLTAEPDTPEDAAARQALADAKAADLAAWYAEAKNPRVCPVCAGRDIPADWPMCADCEYEQMEYMNDPDAWEEDDLAD